LSFGGNGTVPEGVYLNYLVFDDNFTFVNTGFKELSVTTSYTKLALSNIHLAGSGYLIAYVSYESTNADRAYFDDFKVTHKLSPVIQVDDYYPFGGTFNSYTSGTINNYRYNGKELQDNTTLYDYEARQYDAALARFVGVDPKSTILSGYSPYTYVYNNPMRFIDPDGQLGVGAYGESLEGGAVTISFSASGITQEENTNTANPPPGNSNNGNTSTNGAAKLKAKTYRESTDSDIPFAEKVRRWENKVKRNYLQTNFAKVLKTSDEYAPLIAQTGASLNPASKAVISGKVLITGSDFDGKQYNNIYQRYIGPSIDIVTTPFGLSSLRSGVPSTTINFMGKVRFWNSMINKAIEYYDDALNYIQAEFSPYFVND